jgi:hypothetical protein
MLFSTHQIIKSNFTTGKNKISQIISEKRLTGNFKEIEILEFKKEADQSDHSSSFVKNASLLNANFSMICIAESFHTILER